ncbi:unnamed protein product, partial [Ectocarpus sp. 13 AM-2016]
VGLGREELPGDSSCQNEDHQNDGSENNEDTGESTCKRIRVQGNNSLGRRVQFSSVVAAAVSVFDPKDSLASRLVSLVPMWARLDDDQNQLLHLTPPLPMTISIALSLFQFLLL